MKPPSPPHFGTIKTINHPARFAALLLIPSTGALVVANAKQKPAPNDAASNHSVVA
jgi:hypothetical protein